MAELKQSPAPGSLESALVYDEDLGREIPVITIGASGSDILDREPSFDIDEYMAERWTQRNNAEGNRGVDLVATENGYGERQLSAEDIPFLPRVVSSGVGSAVQGVIDLGGELGELVEGILPAGYLTWGPDGLQHHEEQPEDYEPFELPEIPKSGSMAEGIGRGLVQFVAGLMPTRWLGTGIGSMTARSAVSDALFDPEEGGLANFLQDVGFRNALTDFLAVEVGEDATALERLAGRGKLMLEGAGIGLPLDFLIFGLSAIKNNPELRGRILSELKRFAADTSGELLPDPGLGPQFRSGLKGMMVDKKFPDQAPAQQWLNLFQNTELLGKYGAKKEEISLSKLDDFLQEQHDYGNVLTRSDIETYLDENKIELPIDTQGGAKEAGFIADTEIVWGEDDLKVGEILLAPIESGRRNNHDAITERHTVIGTGHVYRYSEADHIDEMDMDEDNYVEIEEIINYDDPNSIMDMLDHLTVLWNNTQELYESVEFSVLVNDFDDLYHELHGLYVNKPIVPDAERTRAINEDPDISPELRDWIAEVEAYPDMIQNKLLELQKTAYRLMGDSGRRMITDTVHRQMGSFRIRGMGDIGGYQTATTESDALHRAQNMLDETSGAASYPSIVFGGRDESMRGYIDNYQVHRLVMPMGSEDPRWPTQQELNRVRGQHFESDTFSFYRTTDRELELDDGTVVPARFNEETQSDLFQKNVFYTRKPGDPSLSELQLHQNQLTKKMYSGLEGLPDFVGDSDLLSSDVKLLFSEEGIHPDTVRRVGERQSMVPVRMMMAIILNAVETAQGSRFSTIDEAVDRVFDVIKDKNIYDNPNLSPDDIADVEWIYTRALRWFQHTGLPQIGADVGLGVANRSNPAAVEMSQEDLLRPIIEFIVDNVDRDHVKELLRFKQQRRLMEDGVPAIPMQKNWEEVTIKSSILQAIEDGHRYIAWPANRNVVGVIEFDSLNYDVNPSIARRYERTIPKILKRLARIHGGEVRMGKLKHSRPVAEGLNADNAEKVLEFGEWDDVIILDLGEASDSAANTIKREGMALPSIAVGLAGLAGIEMEGEAANGN